MLRWRTVRDSESILLGLVHSKILCIKGSVLSKKIVSGSSSRFIVYLFILSI